MPSAKEEGRTLHRSAPKQDTLVANQMAPAVSRKGAQKEISALRAVPREMREARRWIVWEYKPDPKRLGKRKKVPVGAWRDPKLWRSHAGALAACGPKQHLGFVLGDGWAGIDVDGAWPDNEPTNDHGTMREHARAVWDACKGAYVERSPSGTGFKAFVRFAEDTPANDSQSTEKLSNVGEHVGTEVYHHCGRWFAVTGNKLPGCGSHLQNEKACEGWRQTMARMRRRVAGRVRQIEVGSAEGLADIRAVRPYSVELEDQLRDALSLLPSDDWHEWIRFGIALKAMGWSDEIEDRAFDLWHGWSERARNYAGERDCRKQWAGFEPRGDVSVSAIFARAKEAAGDASEEDEAELLAELSKPIPLRDYSMEDFMQIEAIEPPQLVQGLLAPGLTLLFGRQKSGKTYMLLQLAVALATAGQFLGVRIAKPYRVKAYLLEEAGDPALQRARFAEMGFDDAFRGSPECQPNLSLAFGDLPRIDRGGLQRLAEDLRAFDVVLIDSATALDYGKVGRNELDVFRRHYREFSVLQRAARREGKCLFVLSHTRKGSDVGKSSPDDISDSTGGKAAAIDAYWSLQEDQKRDAWRLTVRGRYKACAPLALRHDTESGGHWNCIGPWDAVQLPAAGTGPSTIREKILDVLPLFEPADTAEVVALLPGHAEKAVLAELCSLAEDGYLRRKKGAHHAGKPGRPSSLWSTAPSCI